ncbi:MAG TPA: GNAT family N-acetyltransferase [Solirubrobacteraceae bacterium]
MAVVIDIPERLEGDRVVLRPLETADADTYAQAFADDRELGRLVGFETDPTADQVAANLVTAAERAAAGEFLELAVCSASDGRFIGTVLRHLGFTEEGALRKRNFERGRRVDLVTFGLMVAEWRAVSLVVHWLFAELGIERVEITS